MLRVSLFIYVILNFWWIYIYSTRTDIVNTKQKFKQSYWSFFFFFLIFVKFHTNVKILPRSVSLKSGTFRGHFCSFLCNTISFCIYLFVLRVNHKFSEMGKVRSLHQYRRWYKIIFPNFEGFFQWSEWRWWGITQKHMKSTWKNQFDSTIIEIALKKLFDCLKNL